MGIRPRLAGALERVLELSYPAATLVLPPARAVGYRLAQPVLARSNLPSRPFALADGVAVLAADVQPPRRREQGGTSANAPDESLVAPPSLAANLEEEEGDGPPPLHPTVVENAPPEVETVDSAAMELAEEEHEEDVEEHGEGQEEIEEDG